jgi:uncharacterized peroxidase-related enzyme
MARLKTTAVKEATGQTKQLYEALQKKLGKIPNIFLTMGSNPAVLEGYLAIGKSLEQGKLSAAEREAVALATSQFNNCHYCLSAHTYLGKAAGLKEEEMLRIRQNTGTQKPAQLGRFARQVLEKKGFVSESELQAARQAGYTDEQLMEAVLVIAQTVFTNFFNHVNDTQLDFPAAPELQKAMASQR